MKKIFYETNNLKSRKYINQRAITLVALIVTIIVMLILAGVVVNLVINNGLIDKVQIAVNEYEKASKKEQEDIGALLNKLEEPGQNLQTNTVIYYLDKENIYKEEVEKGNTCLSPKTFIPQKEGWKFIGWREDKNPSKDVLTEKVKEDEVIVLYAIYEKEITLSYNGNGATNNTNISTMVSLAYYNGSGNVANPTFIICENIFDKDYYHFNGWALDSEEGEKYEEKQEIILEKSSTLYAVWEQYLEEIDLKLDTRKKGEPTNTAFTNTTDRKFNFNTYVVGLAFNNYYNPSIVTSYEVSSSEIWQNSASGYGIGIPFLAESGQKYRTKGESNIWLAWAFYDINGKYLSKGNETNTTAPNNAYYGVIILNSNLTPARYYVKNLRLYKIL